MYFKEDKDQLLYDGTAINKDIFMNHDNLVPGEVFTDELLIENGTEKTYTLFLKVIPVEQSSAADELLDKITMNIKLDEETIYSGKATGLDYTSQGINLQDAIELGEFAPSKKSKLVVETKLSEDYDNTSNVISTKIDWSFYGQLNDSKNAYEIMEAPNTLMNKSTVLAVVSIIAILVGLSIFQYAKKKM